LKPGHRDALNVDPIRRNAGPSATDRLIGSSNPLRVRYP
jgi:hypothetical protein